MNEDQLIDLLARMTELHEATDKRLTELEDRRFRKPTALQERKPAK